MAVGIIIHVSVGKEKRTEYFGEEFLRIGSDEISELQIHTPNVPKDRIWLTLEREDGVYRIIDFYDGLELEHNDEPIKRFRAIADGDRITIGNSEIEFSFFSLTSESALITTNREPHQVQFIEEAAIGASATEKRDDAKAFLREFSRELFREISWRTKALWIALFVTVSLGLFYAGYGFYQETKQSRIRIEDQNRVINDLREKIDKTNSELGELNKSNEMVRNIVSLAPNLRVEYGNGVCLIVGVYDLVDRKTGRQLRYPDPEDFENDPYQPPPMEEGIYEVPDTQGLTTEGNGSPVRYDFIGTGFHVGNGFILTNKHVLQPWTEDDLVKQLMSQAGGRAKIRSLTVYFPSYTRAYPLSIKRLGSNQDIAVGFVNAPDIIESIPVLPIDEGDDSRAIGKTVVTMGYPNGPDRLLAMVDDAEAKSINRKFGSSRQALISYLAQSGKILPLTTQGSITDLDGKRIVHDAKTAEGGSGAPLFGQSGKVIGVNFGVFTENNASNLAVPIEYAKRLLDDVGWKTSSLVTKEPEAAASPAKSSVASKAEK
ncbi:MAG: trypsin-like serine protease [Pyrinomonadaceae bacterium]|nr:trypsin-like serine protease [Pyrinomonadaceae bacterium]